ncbi:MAG: GHMP kinase [Lentisphaeria bacterium]|nr:GHMP kinase [Lentisphaeria bacterium]
MIIKTIAFPRAALVGNPSDGYHGKTIAFVFRNYHAAVELYETPELELLPAKRDHNVFSCIDALCADVDQYGYYGGIRLLKAAVKKFSEFCHREGISLEKKNFTIRYSSTIPNRLGLAGSSAIITAAVRAMMEFYHVKLTPAVLANVVLSTERDELGIPAGLQDRVAQAYNTPVYMDFDREFMAANGIGRYLPIEIPKELNLYVAYRTDLAEGSEVLHSRLREDYEAGVPNVVAAMEEWAQLTCRVKTALERHAFSEIPALLDRNFDLRCEVCPNAVSSKNRRMVELARSAGASAKFTGSGGAIIGTYENEAMFRELERVLKHEEINVIKPEIVNTGCAR